MAAQQWQLPGWEEMPNVNRTDYPDHSHYRFARRLQWHRGRTVLWHRILWRRWPRAHHRHLADPAPARTDLRVVERRVGKGASAPCPPFSFQRRPIMVDSLRLAQPTCYTFLPAC